MKSYANAGKSFLRDLYADTSGTVAILVGLCIFVLIGAMGMGIDIGRGQLVEAKLFNAADAAGLAIGARLNTATANEEADKFVRVNFPEGYVGAEITRVTARVSDDDSVIVVDAFARVPTTFMRVLGFDNMDVSVSSEVTRRTTGLELVLVLDVTGSMATPTNYMPALRSASRDLLDILYGDGPATDELFVGVVPFSQAVNVGSFRTSWIDVSDMTSKDWGPTSWQGCVEARGYGRDTTDDTPSDRLFDAYYYSDNTHGNGYYDSQAYNEWRYRYYYHNYSWAYRYRTPFTDSRGPNGYCPESPVTPLTPVKSQVVDAINDLEAVGGTHIPLGAAWGWRMLSPRWRGLWGGEMATYDLPLDYHTTNMDKAMVLMTDGDNTMYGTGYYGAYGRLSDGNLGTSHSISNAQDELDDRLSEICTKMKNAGIIIYTVAFNNPSGSTKAMMQGCASQVDYYFDSPNASDLETAFKTIGDSLTSLRVSR